MEKYGLIGYPLTHSFSEDYLNRKFKSENILAQYVNFEIDNIDMLKEVIQQNPSLNGLNVTIPYKEQVIPFLQEMDETAQIIGAVNVIKFINRKGRLILKGYNSDVIGFSRSIEFYISHKHTKALILGTGGAAKAVKYSLERIGLETAYVSRERLGAKYTYTELDEDILSEYTVIINATPLGMYPKVDTFPDIPYHFLGNRHLLYDLIYNPNETEFLRRGKLQGATIVNGLEMLLFQADASWDIWEERI